MKYRHTKEELEDVVKKSLSISQVCKNLGIIAAGGNYKTIQNKIIEFDIDISHFTGKGWNTGERYRKVILPIPLNEILVKGSVYGSSKLKKRLIDEGLKTSKCECCNLSEWMGNPIGLELHHINGDSNDNQLHNLQILCPNCHSMTDNYRGRNIKTKKTEPTEEWVNTTLKYVINKSDDETKQIKKQEIKQCLTCNGEYTGKSKKYCSIECYYEAKRINNTIPKVPELLEIFEKYKTFTSVGRHYNVSDNAVRKWCRNYGIMEMIQNIQTLKRQ
jgi:Zn finger protein HypA/HybF involved in hydrogenase expression